MKRLLALTLALCMLLTMTACVGVFPAGTPTEPEITEPPASEGLSFTMYDTYCEVSGIGACTEKDVVIPSIYNGLPVTYISDKAFEYCGSLRSVTIPDSVIGIGDSAFLGCSFLTNVTIPDSVISIGASAFKECASLTDVVIPGGVTIISDSVFSSCMSLASVYLPNCVTSIGGSAFSGCSKLTDISIPDSVTSIEWGAFYKCTSLEYNTYGDAYYLGNSNNPFLALVFAKGSITSCDIHEDTKFIVSDAFAGCTSLASVTIPDGVTQIGSRAFNFCWSLTNITIPNSVTSIGWGAFTGCTKLEYNIFDNANYLGNSSNPFLALIAAESIDIESCDIHSNTKIISGGAFQDCSFLNDIRIPVSVRYINMDAFKYCSGLTDITFEGSIEQWGNVALDKYWNYKTPATEVLCSDGTVSLK